MLAQAVRRIWERPELFRADCVALAIDLPTWAGEIELSAQPTLALELVRVASVMRWQSDRARHGGESIEARAFQDFAEFVARAVKALPMEVRRSVLLELGQGPTPLLAAVDSTNANTEWFLSLAATLPPAYRVDVLHQWVEADTFGNSVASLGPERMSHGTGGPYGWAPRRAVWQAIMQLPPEYLPSMLCATMDWFYCDMPSFPRQQAPKGSGFEVAKAQWLLALGCLSGADRLDLEHLAVPLLAASEDRALDGIMRAFDRP